MSISDLKLNCDKIEYVSTDLIEASNDSLNNISAEKLELLKISIDSNGFCYPLIVAHDKDRNKYTIRDGHHRYKLLKEHYKSEKTPVIVLDHDVKCDSIRFQT